MWTNPLFDLSGMCPVRTTRSYPPYTPRGYKFPKKSCRLFLTRLKSMSADNIPPPCIPHREIKPLKITGEIRYLLQKPAYFVRFVTNTGPEQPFSAYISHDSRL